MRQLRVKDFSCIKLADLDFQRTTVIIGPQASGKSVLTKLSYFFLKMIQEIPVYLEDGLSFSNYKKAIHERFCEWFPISAWGAEKFVIEYKIGSFQISLTRKSYRGQLHDRFIVWMSSQIEEYYEDLYGEIKEFRDVSRGQVSSASRYWRVWTSAVKKLQQALGLDSINQQYFVPAGRSFFTSIGKAVTAFEHGRVLDPITLDFGRLHATTRDTDLYNFGSYAKSAAKLIKNLEEIFGGSIKIERGREYVAVSDGREIPFSALSSGQQELLPLLLTLKHILELASLENRTRGKGGESTSVNLALYIEEPEAHLFPSAQSKLVETLVALMTVMQAEKTRVELVLTTHSPYILSKINNLIRGGDILNRVSVSSRQKLFSIVPEVSLLKPGDVAAYAIINGNLKNIMNEYGLIEADYLDQISGDMESEFNSLLELEFEHETEKN